MNRIFASRSFFAVILFFIIILVFRILTPPNNMLSFDVFGYYLYLPLLFIYRDLGIQDISIIQTIIDTYQNTGTFYQGFQVENGNYVMRYSIGMAIIYLPFFLGGHAWAHIFGYATDGFSQPYQVAVVIAALVYTLIGLLYLRKILRQFFSENLSIFIMMLVLFGTNYFQYITYDGVMPHNFTFTLYTLIIWHTIKWHAQPAKGRAFLIGFLCGLNIIARPPELICILIPLLWNIHDRESFFAKFHFVRKHLSHLLFLIFGAFLIGLPQMIYWKYITGHWVYSTYINHGEGLDLFSPHILQYTFSFRKGWLIYTPIMLFPLIGFYFWYKNNKASFVPLFTYFIIHFYMSASWTTWHYGACFSQRNMIQAYPVLAISLGYFFIRIREFRIWKKILIGTFIMAFFLLNLFQTWQYQHYVLDASRMTWPYYKRVFLKTKVEGANKKLLHVLRAPDGNNVLTNPEDYIRKTIGLLDFELVANEEEFLSDTAYSGKSAFRLTEKRPFSSAINIRYKDISKKDYVWIRASAYVFLEKQAAETKTSLVITMDHKGGAYGYHTLNLDDAKYTLKVGEWNYIERTILTPFVRSGRDHLSVYFWHREGADVLVDDLKVEVFEPK